MFADCSPCRVVPQIQIHSNYIHGGRDHMRAIMNRRAADDRNARPVRLRPSARRGFRTPKPMKNAPSIEHALAAAGASENCMNQLCARRNPCDDHVRHGRTF